MADRQFELPVDIRRKSEVVQDRLGLIIILTVIAVFTFLLFLLSVNLGFVLARGAAALPNVELLQEWKPSQSTRIFDRNGTLIANIHGDEDRVVVPLREISPNIVRAVLATEDTRFYQHNGVDFRGTVRAAMQNLKGGDIQGGSTVTQQLVKNLFLTPERSITRKLAEALLAMRVERHYDKDTIMEMYLNQVYWGNQSYGIEKAARRYFRKGAKELSIAESALLAGLLKAPEGLSPYNYPEAARKRQVEVLGKMVENGYITRNQYQASVDEKIELNHRTPKPSKHPYFIAHVIVELEKKFGSDVVRRGGLKVYTTMDEDVQTMAEKALLEQIKSLPKHTGVSEGAFVVEDVQSAQVLALVGGVDFEKNQFNHATMAKRAVGSTFKPFVYLTAMRLGMITPDTMTSDSPVCFHTGYSNWCPKNWDGRYMGGMNIRKALTLSRNTPTVKLGLKTGIDPVIETARLAGIESDIDRNFSSLLGSSGVSPYELMVGYSTFARSGVYLEPTVLLRVEDSRGREIPLEKPQPEQRFDPEPVNNLVSILVDVVEKGTGRNALLEGRQVAGKTGTTDQVRDIWFAGFTPDMVGIVWLGNDKYVGLRGVFSSNAAKVWGDFAKEYYAAKNIPASEFPKPQKILVEKKILAPQSASKAPAAAEVIEGPPVPGGGPPVPRKKFPEDDPRYGFSPLHPGAGGLSKPANPEPAVELKPLIDPNKPQRQPVAVPLPVEPVQPATGPNRPKNDGSG